MFRKILILAITLVSIGAVSSAFDNAQAGSCNAVLAKGRGVNEASASARSLKHLTNRINHWAAKNALSSVGVGNRSTVCADKGVWVCTSSAKVCG
jgi:hypothetical protein